MLDKHTITDAGKAAAKLPVDPIWYGALAAAVKYEYVSEIVSLAAISSIQGSVRVRAGASFASDIVWSHFAHPLFDHIMLLNALDAFKRNKADESIDIDRCCLDHSISKAAIDEVCQLREQIRTIWCRYLKLSYISVSMAKRREPGYSTAVRRALAEGLYTHTAVFHNGRWTSVHDNQPGILLHTSDINDARRIVYDAFVQCGRHYFQVVTAIEPEWIIVSCAISPVYFSLPYINILLQLF